MNEIIKYFDNKGNECKPENAFKIIKQELDDNGKLVSEQIFHKAFP